MRTALFALEKRLTERREVSVVTENIREGIHEISKYL